MIGWLRRLTERRARRAQQRAMRIASKTNAEVDPQTALDRKTPTHSSMRSTGG